MVKKVCMVLGLLMLSVSLSSVFAEDLKTDGIKIDWQQDVVLKSGYTITKTYRVDNYNYVICYSGKTGQTDIWNVNKGGMPIYSKKTQTGWSSFVFFELKNSTYLFTYKKAEGKVIFYKMSSSGISSRAGEYTWSKDWTDFDVMYNNGVPSIIMTRASDGRAKIFTPKF